MSIPKKQTITRGSIIDRANAYNFTSSLSNSQYSEYVNTWSKYYNEHDDTPVPSKTVAQQYGEKTTSAEPKNKKTTEVKKKSEKQPEKQTKETSTKKLA